MKRNYASTAEDLWATRPRSTLIARHKVVPRINKYCIKLRNGGYVALSNTGIMEIPVKEWAEVFTNKGEAEECCRLNWIEADVIPWSE